MVFLYRASEGMTIALLPQFFQDGSSAYFYLDLANNTWVAVTVLAMFTGNAIGAIALGGLMQKKGYHFAYSFMCCAFLVIFPLYMLPHSNTSFLVLRCLSALVFPGPVVLSKITQNTRETFRDTFKHVPMLISLVWFNQGFWFGGAISNSSVWTPWNVFFTSAVILFTLFVVLFTCYLISNKKSTENDIETGRINVAQEDMDNNRSAEEESNSNSEIMDIAQTDSGRVVNVSSDQGTRALLLAMSRDQKRTLLLARLASFINGASYACHISLLPIQVTSLVDLDGEFFH